MGFGLFKKIKQGIKRAITGIGKAGKFVIDKIIKPAVGMAAPIAKQLAPMLDQVKPGLGTAVSAGTGMADRIFNQNTIHSPSTDTIQPILKDGTVFGAAGHGIRQLMG
jgi:hypothetical protein